MAEIVADHDHVGAGLKQRDGAAVAQHMRRDPFVREYWLLSRDRRHLLAQDVGDAVPRERLIVPFEEDMLPIGARLQAGAPVCAVAKRFDTSHQTIMRVRDLAASA
jgi:hypothetical protein